MARRPRCPSNICVHSPAQAGGTMPPHCISKRCRPSSSSCKGKEAISEFEFPGKNPVKWSITDSIQERRLHKQAEGRDRAYPGSLLEMQGSLGAENSHPSLWRTPCRRHNCGQENLCCRGGRCCCGMPESAATP